METRFLFFGILLCLQTILGSCTLSDEEEGPELAAPRITVTPSDPNPFPGDTVVFTIEVKAEAGLALVGFESITLKQYTNEVTEDVLSHTIVIPEGAGVGIRSYNFVVIDLQSRQKRGATNVILDIQNPDFRGNPITLSNFNNRFPDPFVTRLFTDTAGVSNEPTYMVTERVPDPENDNNVSLSVLRTNANETAFNGHGAIQVILVNPIAPEDVQGLINGDRVLQMNVLLQEKPRLVAAHKSPADPESTRMEDVDLSWRFDDHAGENWNFDQQQNVKSIPILIELGNNTLWNHNGTGNNSGRYFYVQGSLTVTNEWQTVTFSRMTGMVELNADNTRNYDNLTPLANISTQTASLEDSRISDQEIDRLAIQINPVITAFINPDGWLQFPDEANGFATDQPFQVIDNHNDYYLDNIRIIDVDDYDKNPNE